MRFAAILAVALAARLVAFALAADAVPRMDEERYLHLAQALARGEGYLSSFAGAVRPRRDVGGSQESATAGETPARGERGSLQPPGYAFFLAVFARLSSQPEPLARLAQVLLSVMTVGWIYGSARAWFGDRAGEAAGLFAALYPNLVGFSVLLFAETLFLWLLMLAVWCLARERDHPSAKAVAAAGALLGLASLTRSVALLFLPLLAAYLIASSPAPRRHAAGKAALLALMTLLVIAPWTARNACVHDGFVLIDTNGPYNLWRGNNRYTFANRDDPDLQRYPPPLAGLPLHPVQGLGVPALLAHARLNGLEAPSELELARFARGAALAHIRGDLPGFLRRSWTKLVDTWNPSSFLVRHAALGGFGGGVADGGPSGTRPARAAHGRDEERERALLWLCGLPYLAALLLAAAGAWRARRHPAIWLAVGAVLAVSAVSALAFGLTRYRLPAMPFLLICAGLGLTGTGVPARPARAAGGRPKRRRTGTRAE